MHNTLLHLLQLSDPTLPIGAYAHSSGLETYVQKGTVRNVATAKEFITAMLQQNLQYTDAAFVSLSFDAVFENNIERLLQLDETATAVKLPKEVREGSRKLGKGLMKIFDALCNGPVAAAYKNAVTAQIAMGHYSIAFGLYAALLGIEKKDALTAFFYNAASGMVTNCVKLVPLGQQDGQELLFSLHPQIEQYVQNCINPDEESIGQCCAGFDIHSMQHEQLYSRLYMS